MTEEFLYYGGIAVMVVSAVAGCIALAVLRISGKRIEQQLKKEYGEKRNQN